MSIGGGFISVLLIGFAMDQTGHKRQIKDQREKIKLLFVHQNLIFIVYIKSFNKLTKRYDSLCLQPACHISTTSPSS